MIERIQIARQSKQRKAQMRHRHRPVDALRFHPRAIEFRYDDVEHHLLPSKWIDAELPFFILAMRVPYRKRGEAFLVPNQVDLKRIDDLEIGDTGIRYRDSANAPREIVNGRRTRR